MEQVLERGFQADDAYGTPAFTAGGSFANREPVTRALCLAIGIAHAWQRVGAAAG